MNQGSDSARTSASPTESAVVVSPAEQRAKACQIEANAALDFLAADQNGNFSTFLNITGSEHPMFRLVANQLLGPFVIDTSKVGIAQAERNIFPLVVQGCSNADNPIFSRAQVEQLASVASPGDASLLETVSIFSDESGVTASDSPAVYPSSATTQALPTTASTPVSVAATSQAPAGSSNGTDAPPYPTVNASTVPALSSAIAAQQHPGLDSICPGQLDSVIANQGDLRGNGRTAYLIDTTCNYATGSTPDEAAVYEQDGAEFTRSVLLWDGTSTDDKLTAPPFMIATHVVRLLLRSGTQDITLTATGASFGPTQPA